MKVIALVGGSGTGKSHKALVLAHKENIEYIIDDGLLIKKDKILARFLMATALICQIFLVIYSVLIVILNV